MAVKNKLIDLNNHLFEQLERLNDDDLTDEKLSQEIERTKGMCLVASQIISNANLSLKAMCVQKGVEMPEMLTIENKND